MVESSYVFNEHSTLSIQTMWEHTIAFKLFCIGFWGPIVAGQLHHKPAVEWWCDEIECFYSDIIPKEEKCDSNNSIPYRFNYTTGACELNLKGLLLSFRMLNNRLGAVAEERNRKRRELIFQGIIISGTIFVGFASVCVFIGCFYCCWVQYSYRQLRKSVKNAAKKVQPSQELNIPKQNTEKKENKETAKLDKCETVAEEIQVSVV